MSTSNTTVGQATGFELAPRSQPGVANDESVSARNRAFAAVGGHEGAGDFTYRFGIEAGLAHEPCHLRMPKDKQRDSNRT